MSDDSSLDRILHDRPVAENVDQLADAFEKDWTPKSLENLEKIVDAVENEEDRSDLLEELLNMEFELRFKKGLPIDQDDYRKRFPRFEKQIQEIYARLLESRRFGNYEYYEIIGKGGLGIVYRARHVLLDRIVAVKSLHVETVNSSDFVNRFLREIRLISKLTHPNIVSAEYADCDKGRYYLVMEYVDGQDLEKIVKNQGELSLGAACEIMRQAVLGIQHASRQGIVHRDIKPGNIMVSCDGSVKVLDFGLGKFQNTQKIPELDHSLTTAGSTMGSVDYIAPEQWEDAASVTVKADIYSLGCTFFHLVTGKAPFRQENLTGNQKMIAHIKGEIPSLKETRDDIPEAVEECYRKMIAKNVDDRFDEPIEILEILGMFADIEEYEHLLESLRKPRQIVEIKSFSKNGKTSSKTGSTPITKCYPKQSTEQSGSEGKIPRKNYWGVIGAVMMLFLFVLTFFTMSAQKEKAETQSAESSQHLPQNLSQQEILPQTALSVPTAAAVAKTTTTTRERTVEPVEMKEKTSPPKPNDVFEPSISDLIQFTGYSGKWWFHEIPWLLPEMREALVWQSEEDNEKTNGIASKTKDSDATPCQDLRRFSKISAQKFIADKTERSNETLRILVQNLSSGTPSASWHSLAKTYIEETEKTGSPSVRHTQAVLLHAMVVDQTDPGATDRTRSLYQQAISGYRKLVAKNEKSDNTSQPSNQLYRRLENLCRFDLAWLEFQLNEDADEFQQTLFALSSFSDSDSAAFRLELIIVPAEWQMRTGRDRKEIFEDVFEQRLGLNPKGPQIAWLHRRYAAVLTKQWRLAEARNYWKIAVDFIQKTMPSTDEKSPYDFDPFLSDRADFIRRCRSAEALADRHTGNLTDARRKYRDLIEELRGLIAAVLMSEKEEAEKKSCRTVLENGLSQTLESLADCTLFTPAYFGPRPPRSAGYFVEETEELYTEAAMLTNEPDRNFVLQCKLALLFFCDNNLKKTIPCWNEAKRLYEKLPETPKNPRAENYFGMSKAVFSAFDSSETILSDENVEKNEDKNVGQNFRTDVRGLRGLLDHFRLHNNAFDRYEGEKLDIQLFCIRLLLDQSEANDERRQSARSDVERYLDPILLQHLHHECSMRPFLNDYYDMVIRLQDGDDMVKTTEYIHAMRCQRRSGTTQGAHLIFYFSPADVNGFALFLPPEMQTPRRFELNMDREAVFRSVRLGKSLELPSELVGLVNKTWGANKRLVLSWEDSPCWRRKTDCLTSEEWPFDEQLDRNRLFGIVK